MWCTGYFPGFAAGLFWDTGRASESHSPLLQKGEDKCFSFYTGCFERCLIEESLITQDANSSDKGQVNKQVVLIKTVYSQ